MLCDMFEHFTGGQKVIRCELSLDDGKSWRLAEIKRIQEKPNRGGKYWAWVFWEIPIPTGKHHGCRNTLVLIAAYKASCPLSVRRQTVLVVETGQRCWLHYQEDPTAFARLGFDRSDVLCKVTDSPSSAVSVLQPCILARRLDLSHSSISAQKQHTRAPTKPALLVKSSCCRPKRFAVGLGPPT